MRQPARGKSGAVTSWYLGEGLADQINALKRLRDAVDKSIAEKTACGEDTFELQQIREQEDRHIAALTKDYATLKSGAASDFGLTEIACAVLGAGAFLLPTP